MAKKALRDVANPPVVDVACVIHGTGYDWTYVDRLYNMVTRNLDRRVNFHVYTEESRLVPSHMIKHVLEDWPGVSGPRKSWWYKMQLFNTRHFQGRLLYLDLDTVIVNNIDWLWALDYRCFWTLRDYRRLWRSNWTGINSSVMLWDTSHYGWIWNNFNNNAITTTIKLYPGDQDYLNKVLSDNDKKFIPENLVKSYRWEIKDAGLDFKTRIYKRPDAGTIITPDTSIIVFHGQPKPHEVDCPVIQKHWC